MGPGTNPTSPPLRPAHFLTVRQVCDLVHRCPRTIRRWIHAGDLPGTRRVKDGYLIPEAALERLLEPIDGEEP